MAIFTLEEVNAQIAAYKEALLVLATHQEYRIGTRTMRRSDLPEVRKTLQFLEKEKAALVNGSGRFRVHTTPVGDSW